MEKLARLNEADREILLLAAWEELSTTEIAAVLGCSVNAAALRLHRARKRLTKVYEKENSATGHIDDEARDLRRPADMEER